jgi:bifunctional DNase/RNase
MPELNPKSAHGNMEKIRLEITGLSYSQLQSGAYALVLNEKEGPRRLPIIIGNFEAQSIAMELEKIRPGRPLTHDLFVSFATKFEINLKEVLIDKFVEGVFHAKLICEQGGNESIIDSRTSDAVALAVRFKCPIFTYEHILKETGVVMDGNEDDPSEEVVEEEPKTAKKSSVDELTQEQLEKMMQKAIEAEDYEKASKIRDELNRRENLE